LSEFIVHEIKEPIDLTKVDWSFFTGGLAVPITKDDPEGKKALEAIATEMINIMRKNEKVHLPG